MKRFAEQFNKKASGIKLHASERRELRDRIISYMEYHPLPAHLRPQQTAVKKEVSEFAVTSERFTTFTFDFGMIRNVVGLVAIILVVGVPVVAERSIPGDVLYPVKVQFNEEVRSTLAISPYAQVEWDTQRLERRVAEARLLASEGKLTGDVEAEVAEAIKTHSDSAKANIAKIRETDADDAAIAEIAFASALSVQNEALEGQVAKENTGTDGQSGRSVAKLATVIAEETRVAEATQAASQPSYEKLLARVEQETTEAYELFASIEDVASAEELQNIERRLSDIERKVNEAIALHERGQAAEETEDTEESNQEPASESDPESEVAAVSESDAASTSDAVDTDTATATAPVAEVIVAAEPAIEPVDPAVVIALLRSALTDTQKLIGFMTNIDIRENVNIDELVPVSLTDDEKIVLIKNTLSEVAAVELEIEKRSVPASAQEKFTIGEERLDGRVAAAETALAASELTTAQAHADEALIVVSDLFAMTSAAPVLQDTASVSEVDEESSTTTDSTDSTTETGASSTEAAAE